ncbi:hypothetical protein H8356DRAFT_1683914 [Neocallimastix lanati (nom. inval.)]|nr:hypothetical protein H8356DRAFT_1683914 [Neocallimastix sp. JGI-2020a]
MPSSSTKVTEIKINKEDIYGNKQKAINQFKNILNDKNNKIIQVQNLDINKNWLMYLDQTCGANTESELIKTSRKKKFWYWERY